jgi:hypothetical protein
MLAAALDAARRDRRVILLETATAAGCSCWRGRACRSAGKHPHRALGDTGDEHAIGTTDPALIREWWTRFPEGNLGIATGARSGLVVLDVDPARGGAASLADLFPQGRPRTLMVRTGSGGEHVYFAHPGQRVECRVGFRPGLDIRADGGLVVAPPSLHRSGERYAYVGDSDTRLALMPAELVAALARSGSTPRLPASRRVFRGTLTRYAEAALDRECAELASWPRGTEGGRIRRVWKTAACLGELVACGNLPADLVRAHVFDAALRCGVVESVGERKVREQIERGLEVGALEPRRHNETTAWAARPRPTEWAPRRDVL